MDSIDITDSSFSLDVPSIIGGSLPDNNFYLYIGVAILIAIVGLFIFKFYRNKTDCNDSSDSNNVCDAEDGGFCTMGQRQI
jgi:hypothetical protein